MRRCAWVWAGILLVAAAAAVAARSAGPEQAPKDVFRHWNFRNLGPAVAGGRVTAVAGIPGNPRVYYVGAAAGGVFKSADGGQTWQAVFEHEATASIGALALAPSNPNLVWVGTGEANIRSDLIDGAGVYFSPDGGRSWQFKGLRDAGQIASIVIDPADPNVVFVGVLGHAWAPNAERGVFRTEDGGKTWKKVLFVNDQTGCIDLVMAPGNPEVLYAALWEARRFPWTLVDGGAASGIYRSTDGGETWQKLGRGLPEGPLGRIALAVVPTDANRVYALIAAKEGMLWASDNMGESWRLVNESHALDVRPFYFSRLFVSPADPQKIYFLSFNLLESDDGGKTFHVLDRSIHPDHHALWIDPKDPERILQGNDGGAFLSLNGGRTWRFLDGLPIEQFYEVAATRETPYLVCGGLQDNGSWCGPSSDHGRRGVTGGAWFLVADGDGEYVVPAPSDPNIVYADSQDGFIVRVDRSTHYLRFLRPYAKTVSDAAPANLRYRFNWTSPIAVSPNNPDEVYLGGNVLFRSTDGGTTWTPASPDLTRNDKSKQAVAGGPVQHDISGAETYDTILSITLAPSDPKVIWVGSDDGLVHVTRDGGAHWTDVTARIPGAPAWARVYQIGVSPFSPATAYVAFDAHELGDRHPYVFKTSDYGQTWQRITTGLPEDSPVYVVREDPNRQGLLVLGSDTGLYDSPDAGAHWQKVGANFPTAPVYDLKFVRRTHDLVVATHGRGIFVLDDLRPLEEWSASIETEPLHLFTPRAGTLFHHWESDEGQGYAYSAPNAPEGVVVDYYLASELKASKEQKKKHETPVKIVIRDAKGSSVATRYGPSRAGLNRFVWDLRFDGPTPLRYEKQPPANPEFPRNEGPRVIPGTYTISVTAGDHTEKQTADVQSDPTLKLSPADLRAEAEAALEARNELSAVNQMINRIDSLERQLAQFEEETSSERDAQLKTRYAGILGQGKELREKLAAIKATLLNPEVQHDVPEDSIHHLARLHEKLQGLAFVLALSYGTPPSAAQRERMAELRKELDGRMEEFNRLLESGVAAYNKAAEQAGAPTLFVSGPVRVAAATL